MSLLLDALKRAEQEKLTRQGDRPVGAGERGPAAANAPSAAVLELQPISASAPGGIATRGDAQAAQAVFKAKAAQEPARNRGVLWAGAAAIGVVVIAAAVYVWYSINSLAPPLRTASRPRPAPIAPPASDPLAPRADAPFVPPDGPAEPGRSSAAPPPAGEPAQVAEVAHAAPPRSAVDELLAQPAPLAQNPVRLMRSEEPKPRVPHDVQAGYAALVAGDVARARASYAAALAADATNVDALLGLATADAHEGDTAGAALRYRRALELDPQNATAIAGLAALADFSRPEAIEGELRGDVARHPQSAALHFTLGNLYASQSRWGEAQAEYFECYRLDPSSADFAYNLAVSLDHLGSRKPAADYYRKALAAARSGPRQFDPGVAAHRLAVLEQR